MTPQLLAAAPAAIGFRGRTALDESPQTVRRTRLAVSRAKQGDPDAVRFLYITYAHNIYGYVRSIVRDDHEAEDVTQHVFAKLMTTIAKYDERGVPFFAWLLRLARNVAIDHLRCNRVTPTENLVDRERISGVDLDRAESVRLALATLPDDQRHVVLLRHLVGLTPGEIADKLGRSESSVHGLHHRGRRALQRELERLDSTPCTRRMGDCWRREKAAAADAGGGSVSGQPSAVGGDPPSAVRSALDRPTRDDVTASAGAASALSDGGDSKGSADPIPVIPGRTTCIRQPNQSAASLCNQTIKRGRDGDVEHDQAAERLECALRGARAPARSHRG